MFKRIGLFLITNILIMITISFVLNLLGFTGYLDSYGINYPALMIFCFVWGMGGALISLAMSKKMAKWIMGVKIISPQKAVGDEAELIQRIKILSMKAKLPKVPEVGIYESPEINAFATGSSKRNSLVAVSRGLLSQLNTNELDGVLGHEIAHIANGDMVTLTLIQGVVNAFTMFLARVLAFFVMSFMRGDEEEGNPFMYYIFVFAFDILFSILGSMIVAHFSRIREFRADQGGARVAGRENMISALQKLKQTLTYADKHKKTELNAMKISSNKRISIFATHPSLDERIKRLKQQHR